MIGSLVTTNCSCQNCCSAEYATPTPDNLPDQIAVQYSGVPSFFEPNWCSQWKTTGTDSTGTVDLFYSRYRESAHPVLNWSGTLDRLVIDGVPTDEYFKYFPEGNRQTYELTGIDESRWHEIVGFGTRVTKTRTHTFTSKFEIVGVYVARIKIATTETPCQNENLGSKSQPIDSAGSAWFADIIIEIKPGTETFLGNTKDSITFSGGTQYLPRVSFFTGSLDTNSAIDIVTRVGLYGFLDSKQPNDIPIATTQKSLNRYTSVRKLAFGQNFDTDIFANVANTGLQESGTTSISLLNIEDFLTSTATEEYKRKQYLVPVRMDPNTCTVSPSVNQEFASEYIDRNSILDPANSEIIPFIAPSSLIRNNTDPISISLTNNDMSLPYGLYKLNILERANTRSSPCTLGNDPRLCEPELSCCDGTTFPGCPVNIPCQTAVCAADSTCCSMEWDSVCAALARKTPECGCTVVPFCGSSAAGDCLTSHATPFCNELGCCQTVCSMIPSCCETEWSADCVDLAAFFCGGIQSGFTNNLTTNLPAFCNQSYYIGHGNLYKIQSPHPGCHFSYSTCGFRYVFGQEQGSINFVKTPPGSINYNCAYDFLKTPACILTERPIESVFGSSYLPETYRIEYFDGTGSWPTGAQGEGNTSMPFCFNLDESGSVELLNGVKQWCGLPQTTFPKIRSLPRQVFTNENGSVTAVNNNGLFATSAVLTILPVP